MGLTFMMIAKKGLAQQKASRRAPTNSGKGQCMPLGCLWGRKVQRNRTTHGKLHGK